MDAILLASPVQKKCVDACAGGDLMVQILVIANMDDLVRLDTQDLWDLFVDTLVFLCDIKVIHCGEDSVVITLETACFEFCPQEVFLMLCHEYYLVSLVKFLDGLWDLSVDLDVMHHIFHDILPIWLYLELVEPDLRTIEIRVSDRDRLVIPYRDGLCLIKGDLMVDAYQLWDLLKIEALLEGDLIHELIIDVERDDFDHCGL
mgnify:CR=1 FL=1